MKRKMGLTAIVAGTQVASLPESPFTSVQAMAKKIG